MKVVKGDFTDSMRFIQKEKPVIGKAVLVISGINLFLSAMIIVALPYLVTEILDLGESWQTGFTATRKGHWRQADWQEESAQVCLQISLK